MSADDVLDQADALMRRHRSFVARDTSLTPQAPGGMDADEALPDIPVLTEKVDAVDAPPLHAELGMALETELNAWLDAVLPQQIEQVQTEFKALLLTRLDQEMRAALLPRLQAALTETLTPKT